MRRVLLSSIGGAVLGLSLLAPAATAAGSGGGETETVGNNLSVPAIFVPSSTAAGAPALRVSCASTPQSPQGPRAGGYWEAASDGGVFALGSAPFIGSMGATPLNKPIVAIASTANWRGYWLVGSDGAVFSFNAPSYGSMAGKPLNKPIVGMATDPATGGYWLAASDGGVFSFNAPFYGSMGGTPLNKPIVGIASSPTGQGYELVASDGGVFNFGDSVFHGSMGGTPLNKPVVGVATDPATGGYWLAASDGGVFSFNAPFYGSMGGTPLNKPIVGIASSPTGQGYELVASDGGVFNFGDSVFYGSMGGKPLNAPVVGISHYPGYWIQGTGATWSATCTERSSATVAAAWGDNLLSAARANKQNRVEVALLDTTDPGAIGSVGYPITNLTPTLADRYATYGTDGTTVLSDGVNMVTHVWGPGATLKITGPSGTVYDGPITAEINSSGAVVFGYNWPASPAGSYTLTFSIGAGVTINGGNGTSTTASTTTLQVTLSASGGGGGGGGSGA